MKKKKIYNDTDDTNTKIVKLAFYYKTTFGIPEHVIEQLIKEVFEIKNSKISMKKTKAKDICTVCLDCGRENGNKNKEIFGVWNDTCDMCGKKNVPCASAAHDFGIYSSEDQKLSDEFQDLI